LATILILFENFVVGSVIPHAVILEIMPGSGASATMKVRHKMVSRKSHR